MFHVASRLCPSPSRCALDQDRSAHHNLNGERFTFSCSWTRCYRQTDKRFASASHYIKHRGKQFFHICVYKKQWCKGDATCGFRAKFAFFCGQFIVTTTVPNIQHPGLTIRILLNIGANLIALFVAEHLLNDWAALCFAPPMPTPTLLWRRLCVEFTFVFENGFAFLGCWMFA